MPPAQVGSIKHAVERRRAGRRLMASDYRLTLPLQTLLPLLVHWRALTAATLAASSAAAAVAAQP